LNSLRIALRVLLRKKIRSLLTVGGVAIAVAVLVSLLAFDEGYQQGLRTDIDRMGYQVLVTAKGCPYEAATLMMQGGGGLRYMEEDVYNGIVGDERIQEIAPQLMATVFDSTSGPGGGSVTLYVGIDEAYFRLKPWLAFKAGGWFSGSDAEEAIMGYEAAELEQRSIGDQIYVSSVDRVLTVVGILERTGTQDDGITFVPLKRVQEDFGLPGKMSGIGIRLKDITQMSAFEEDLYNVPGIQVVSMAQVKGTILNLMSSARVLASSIATVAVIIAVIGVMNTILVSVFERTKQIGVMKAMGASRFDVFRIIWTETALISLFGGALGIVMALVGGTIVEHVIRRILPYAPSGRLVTISPSLVVLALVGAVLTGLVAGIYPAWRASSMKPVEAIRSAE
jgi:putative ABC transport system permease protein